MAQPDLHPDADLLNAFVEHALSGTERTQVVAHMAGCARCRDVVYLAQAAANPEMTSGTAPAPARKSEPVGWFSAAFTKWRVALIPAAALAAVGSVVLWVQLHPRPTELAQLTSPRPESPAAVAPPPSQQQESRAADREQAMAVPVSPSPARPGSSERSPAIAPKKTPAPAKTGNAPALSEPADQNRQPAEIHLDGRSAAMARYTPPQPVGTSSASTYLPEKSPVVREASEANGHPSAAFAARSAMVPAPSPASPGVLAVQNEVVNPTVGGPTQVAVQSLQQVDMVSQPTNGLPVLRLAKRARLPSGLNTISSAVLLNRLVAVDSQGSVFLSQDGGRRWEPVLAQWTGKAVEVQAPSPGLYRLMPASDDRSRQIPAAAAQATLNTSAPDTTKDAPAPPPVPSAMSSSPALAAKAKASPTHPALLFKLVTDRHEIWVSADGKTWREQ